MITKLIVAIAAVFICSVALADDLVPPKWRGEADTTFQLWEFSNDINPAVPDLVNNPYGGPIATILGTFPKTLWLATDRGQEGVWVTEEWIQLDIFNTDNTAPNSYKEIWLQMTFDVGEGAYPVIVTSPGAVPLTLEPIFTAPDPTGTYTYGIWDIIIEPNPRFETIYILPRECTLYVDEIVVDTRCVPEPTTIMMMVLGGIALFIRKK